MDDALAQCELLPLKGARIAKDAIKKAAANAIHQKGLDASSLVVDEIWVTKGQYRKRIWPHGRGSAGIRFTRYTHLNVIVRERPETRVWAKLVRPYQMRGQRRSTVAAALAEAPARRHASQPAQ